MRNAAETFFQAAKDLDRVAAEQITAFGTGIDTYRQGASPSALEFESRVRPRGDELRTSSLLGLGEAMNTAAMLTENLGRLATALKKLATILGSPGRRAFAVGVGKNFLPSAAKTVDDDVSLPAADTAARQMADKEAADRRAEEGPPKFGAPLPPLEKPRQGPGLGVRWTTSGTLDEVPDISVRVETEDTRYPVPGLTSRSVRVKPGDVVVFDMPDGQLVFPAKNAERLRRFVEERCRALVGDG